MKNYIQGNLIIAAEWANFTGRISRQRRAVSGLARIDENEGKSVMKLFTENRLIRKSGGQKPQTSAGFGLAGISAKKQGGF